MILTWVLDRAADLDLASWIAGICLLALTVALRPLTPRLAADDGLG